MAETLLKTVCGVAISVTDAGKFKAKRGYYSDQYRVKRSNYGEQNLSEVISFPADCFEYDAAVKEEYLTLQKRQEAELNELTKRHGEEQKEIKSRMKRVTSERLQQMLVEANQAETTETE